MAWNYRKRVKIAPGVHLNFSKNGVSTSIGPKGAKVTFGKNGTYMNTSIPGTGLYSRQKISGGRGTSTNKENSIDQNGCSGCIIIGFCLGLAILGGISVSTGNSIAVLMGIIFIVIAIIVFYKSVIAVDNETPSQEVPKQIIENTYNEDAEEAPNNSQNVQLEKFVDEPKKFLGIYDPLFEDAANLIISEQSGSTSLIQRKFSIGYNRAGLIMDQLEKVGVVGPANGAKPREVLVHNEDEWLILKSQLLVKIAKKMGSPVNSCVYPYIIDSL